MKNIYKFYKIFLLVLLFKLSTFQVCAQTFDATSVRSINQFITYINRTNWGISQNYFIFSDTYHWVQNGEQNIAEKFRHHSFAGTKKESYSDGKLYNEISLLRNEPYNQYKQLTKLCDSIHFIYKQIINYSFELRKNLLQKRYLLDNYKKYFEIIDKVDTLYKTYHRLHQSFRKETNRIAQIIVQNNKADENYKQEMKMRKALDYQLNLLFYWNLYMNGGRFPQKLLKQNTEYTEKEFMNFEKTPDIDPYIRYHYKRFYSYLNNEHQALKKRYLKYTETGNISDDPKFLIWHLISAFDIRCIREHNEYVKKAQEIGLYMLKYSNIPYLFMKNIDSTLIANYEKKPEITKEDSLYKSMDGYAINNLILLLDVSSSMNTDNKLPILKQSFKRLMTILRDEDYVSIVIYSGKAKLVLQPTSCSQKVKIIQILEAQKGGGTTNLATGLMLAFSTATDNLIPKGNNRIILATDGQFKIDKKLIRQTKNNSKKGIYLSVFKFGSPVVYKDLKKIAMAGKGNYECVNKDNIATVLIKEAKAIKQ